MVPVIPLTVFQTVANGTTIASLDNTAGRERKKIECSVDAL
jgi:hypothetical protein